MSTDDPSTIPRRERLSPVQPKWPADPDDRPTPSRRDEVVSYAALSFIAGVWLMISPWVCGYRDDDPWWNAVLFGIAVETFALVRALVPSGTRFLGWFTAGIGLWLFASAFVLPASAVAAWNAGILGVIVLLLAALALSAR